MSFCMLDEVRLAAALAFTLSLVATAQQTSTALSQKATAFQTAEQQYKNIKVLTGTRADQLILGMHGVSGQLGVDCVHCHTWEEWDKDGKPAKEVARRMMSMVRDMNTSYFGGAQVVTCYTCHRGSLHPLSTTILPDTIGLRGPDVPGRPLPTEEEKVQAPRYPTPGAIIAKYVQALGGEARLRSITSRVIQAKRDLPSGPGGLVIVPAAIEIYQQAPNLALTISKTEKFTIAEGFDGKSAWAQNAAGIVTDLPEPDQQRTQRNDDLWLPLDLEKNYESLQVTGLEKVNGRDTYVVVGRFLSDSPERLYFEVQSGLLRRRWTSLPTALGTFPYQVDYEGYRKTASGTLYPFLIRSVPGTPRVEPIANSTLKILELKENVLIDPKKFSRPVSAPRKVEQANVQRASPPL